MPPKKEEIDLNALPPLKHLCVSIRIEAAKSRATKLLNLLKTCKSFQKNIQRDEILAFCKEKQLYVDPATLTDKQKKDPKFMAEVATELTSEVMNKAFQLFIQDQVLAVRKARYLAAQAQAAEKAAPPKKDDKKDTKKGAKEPPAVAPIVEPEKVVPEKDYPKNFDLVFIVQGFPQVPQEQIELIIHVKERVINWGGVDMNQIEQPEEFQDDFEKRMEEFVPPPPIKRQYSEESLNYAASERSVIEEFKSVRASSLPSDPLRQLTIKELILDMDLDAEEETIKQFYETIFEEICQFSIDQQQYAEWIANKKPIPLINKEAPKDPFDLEVERIKHEAQLAEEQQKAAEEAILAEKNKKGAKKEPKKNEAELEAERQAEAEKHRLNELRKQQIQDAIDQQLKMKTKLHLQYYKRQLSDVQLQKVGPGTLLECLLDQLQAESTYLTNSQVPPSLEDQDDSDQVNRILTGLKGQGNESVKNRKQEQVTESPKQLILDECDWIEMRAYFAQLHDQQLVVEREHKIFDNLCYPGIDRQGMPEIPEKSEKMRKAIKAKLHPFVNVDVNEFERRQLLLQFEELLKENEPEKEWHFGDRIYMERHNRNTLRQKFYEALLNDPQVIMKYLPDDDALMICCYYKNPPGRTLRKKWSAEWRVLPNLEYYIQVRNFNSDYFYDIDYQKIGAITERCKIMYPTDNSLILATKFTVGEQERLRYRVIKENIVFGIQCGFYAQFKESRMSVQDQIMNLTFKNGLCLRFTQMGEVVQQYHNQKAQESSQHSFNLYDNTDINSEQEIKRVITGQGSVIIYKKDGSIIILYSNGNVSHYKNNMWITTNNKGYRQSPKGVDKIPCAIRTDPESGSKVYIRDDQTLIIYYKEGYQYTQHQDGTVMLIKGDKIIVEHPNFASVVVTIDKAKQRSGTIMRKNNTTVGFDNIIDRSHDGRIVETFYQGCKVVSYLEKYEIPDSKQYKTNRIHLLYTQDGGVSKCVADGEVVIITAEERVRLNNKGEKRQLGQDIDYWVQLFSLPDERRSGVYTIDLERKCIFTRDEEANYFEIDEDGHVVTKLSTASAQNQEPYTPDQIPDGIFVDEENKVLPTPKQWIPPRLFLVRNDNTGIELYNQYQLQDYFRLKSENAFTTKIIEDMPNNVKSISFITELKQQNKKFIDVKIPQTLDIVPKIIQKTTIIAHRVFTFRNFLEYPPFEKEERIHHELSLQRFEIWQKNILKTQNEFGILQKSEEEKEIEFAIQMKILESRRTDYSTESYDQAKSKIQIPEQQITSVEPLEQTLLKSARVQQTVQQAFVDLSRKAQTVQIQKQFKPFTEVKGFAIHYFETNEGLDYLKSAPEDPPIKKQRQKVVQINEEPQQLQIIEQFDQQPEGIVPLEQPPQPQYNNLLTKVIIKPSVFTQAEIDDEIRQKRLNDESVKYRMQKRKDIDVYGKERKDKKLVPCLLKTNPKLELNQKYILTDATTDNRVKISSMATRVYQQAAPVNQIRNEGMHQTIIRTLDKKNNLDELIDKKNLMVTGDINDRLKKDLLIYPISVQFGELRQNGIYEFKINVKNEDIMTQRIVLKQPQNSNIKVLMKVMGPISLGLVREVFIQVSADKLGQFSDEFQILSKHSIYTIPLNGNVLDQNIFDKLNTEQIKLSSKPLLKKNVKDMLQQFKQQDIIGDSQDSDLLPKINYDKNYKIDPFQNQKKEDQSYDDEN
ncbi:unnamed protein product [Paramecium octaurelia]|uniref:Sperm-associated antigen 17 n=1 Tax=Paramecium octaurelia TaxID=43137 RepID=A0A8S1XA59_PAROT|nr:unnamed protein product [Paramecium octaurelia]